MRSKILNRCFLAAILLLSLYSSINAQDIKVLSSDQRSVRFLYTPNYTDTTVVKFNSREFYSVSFDNGSAADFTSEGDPQVSERLVNVGVPSELGTKINILSEKYSTINGSLLPVPTRGVTEIKYAVNDKYNTSAFTETLMFGSYGISRGLRVQQIKINPVQFDAASNTIRLLTQLVVEISFGSPEGQTETITDFLLDGTVLNFNVARNWGIKKKSGLRKVNNSILADGTWYRFEVSKEGFYKITRDQLSQFGIDPATVDPATIKIYNNGGTVLPEANSWERPDGLKEIAISVVMSGSNIDYVLFYGRGTSFWEYDSRAADIIRRKHWYTKNNLYWITSGGSAGKRITEKLSLNETNNLKQNTTQSFLFRDDDFENKISSGKIYVGDSFNINSKSRTYINSMPNRVAGSQIDYKFQIGNFSPEYSNQLTISESNSQIFARNITGNSHSYWKGIFSQGIASYQGELTDNRSQLKFSFGALSASSNANLDYFEISYLRDMFAVDDTLVFFSNSYDGVIEYSLEGFHGSTESIKVYDVTDFANVKIISGEYKSGALVKFQSNENTTLRSKYFALTEDKFKTPSAPVQVTNSNIRGDLEGARHIIITDDILNTAAQELCDYRNNQAPEKLSSKIFHLADIYNEFSGGLLDPTAIRDFIKYAYNNWTIKPEYVVLFGDGSFDVLNTDAQSGNVVPTMQTYASHNTINSYPYDDYFVSVEGDDNLIELAVGRICVNNPEEAQVAVEKIKKYESESDLGIWRNRITLVADDAFAEGDGESYHVDQSETLSSNYIPSSFDLTKIYLSAYPTVQTGEGRRKPSVTQSILDAINNETLIMNYTGHGAHDLWAHEHVFEQARDISKINNSNLFLLTVASCDFALFDNHNVISASEELMNLKSNSDPAGAVAVFAAARPVEALGNAALNNSFYKNLLIRNSDGKYPTLGQAYVKAKVEQYRTNSLKFLLLGDPAIRLNVPNLASKIDSINGVSAESEIQIKALSEVEIKGSVIGNNNEVKTDFDGEATLTFFDSERGVYLEDVNRTMKVQGGVIFKGKASIVDGKYETRFVVPKDISYENKNGKVVAYFTDFDNDGVGFTNNVIIGGTGDLVNDNQGPDISIYFDDVNFENSTLVNPNFNLVVKIEDETGLNTTGTGIGHKLEAIIDDNTNQTIDLTSYFVGEINAGGKSGLVNYRFTGMEPGDHKIKIKAWDVFNNPSFEETYFTVVSDEGLVIDKVYNFPNPFSSSTTFTFQHNIASPIDVKIKVYTVAGRLIKEIEELAMSDKFVRVFWDGRDQDGDILANGTYFYKINVNSIDGEFKNSVIGKIAIIK